jgi:hypothetical protein
MLVSGICQKILVSRLDKYPSPVGGSGNLSKMTGKKYHGEGKIGENHNICGKIA